jgi:hypothetical protein
MLKGRRGATDKSVGGLKYIGPYTAGKTIRGTTAHNLGGFGPYNPIYDPDHAQ